MNSSPLSRKLTKIIHLFVALLTLQVAIVTHEYGHYVEYKKRNFEPKEFWIGRGPTILSFQKDGTLIILKLFPISGQIVHLEEDFPIFEKQTTLWEKFIISSAGVRNNFIAAFVTALLFQIFALRKRKVPLKTALGKIIRKLLKLISLPAFLTWKIIFWRKKDLYDKRFHFVLKSMFQSSLIIKSFIFWNYSMVFFNLLPVFPLDGGSILTYIISEIFTPSPSAIEYIKRILLLVFILILMRSGIAVKKIFKISKEKQNQKQTS